MVHSLTAMRMGVFAYMQRELSVRDDYKNISDYVRRNFALLRQHAEELASFQNRINGVASVTMEQIYAAFRMTGELTDNDMAVLMDLERKAIALLSKNTEQKQECEELLPVEAGLVQRYPSDISVLLLVGASHRARIKNSLEGAAVLGASLGGIILVPYIEWLLERSIALGLRRLYFIARDGYVLKKIADCLIDVRRLPLETYYIYGSRRAWRMPSYRGMEGELRGLVGWSSPQRFKELEDLADALQIPVDVLRAYLPDEYAVPGRRFIFSEVAMCVYLLDKDAAFRQRLLHCQNEARSLTVKYLQQELDTSDDDFAFVELGGSGFTQICLSHLLQDFYSGQVRTFFYKMDRVRPSDGKCIFYNFFPSKLTNDLVIEMLCRAPGGQTEGYCYKDGRVIPIQREVEDKLRLTQAYGAYLMGVEAFTRTYADIAACCRTEPSIEASFYCMNFISSQTNGEILDFLGSIPSAITGRERIVPEFAPPLTREQVRDIFIKYGDNDPWSAYHGSDFGLSVKRSTPDVQKLVKKYQLKGDAIRKRWHTLYPFNNNTYVDMDGLGEYPYSILGRKIVIYGAGQKGRQLYERLQQNQAVSVVQWLDRNYVTLSERLPVDGSIEALGNVLYDCVIIAIAQKSSWSDVKQELLAKGVPEEKIFVLSELESQWIEVKHSYLHV